MTAGLSSCAALRPLLAEIGDAKRVRTAVAPGSLAEQAFARAWARLVAGEDAGRREAVDGQQRGHGREGGAEQDGAAVAIAPSGSAASV